MNRIESLKEKINNLYLAKNPKRADWSDWLHTNHIFVVAEYAEKLAERYGANKELAVAAAMLHDVADSVMSRFFDNHEEKSSKIARELLTESGFTNQEIQIIVEDEIKLHSCHSGKFPQTLEGKVMATADALAHLKTDFYEHATQAMKANKTPTEISQWALPKIERDFNNKIFFKEVRDEVRPYYEKLKSKFSV